jgi:hypothetical protein
MVPTHSFNDRLATGLVLFEQSQPHPVSEQHRFHIEAQQNAKAAALAGRLTALVTGRMLSP